MQRECITFYDLDCRLNVWPIGECETFQGFAGETIYGRDGCFVSMPIFADDGLASWLTLEQACERIAAGGAIPPDQFLESVGLRARQSEKTTNKRKRRSKPTYPPGSHGLRAFNESRQRHHERGTIGDSPDSRETHDSGHR